MELRRFVLVFGIVYAVLGVLGFIPGVTQPPPTSAPSVAMSSGYGYLFGLFPVNAMHDLVHILTGVLGIAAYASFRWARLYSRVFSIVFLLLTIMGFIPGADTMFGMAPLFGNDIWLHALTTIVTGYFGWVHKEREVGVASEGRTHEPGYRAA